MSDLLQDLNNISQQIPNLSLAKVVGQIEQPAVAASDTWAQSLQSNLKKLENVISIRRHEQAVKPMVTAEEKRQIAQWGLLHRDKNVYQTSIEQAVNLLQVYYQVNEIATRNVINELQSAGQQNIAPELPDLTPLIKELEQR